MLAGAVSRIVAMLLAVWLPASCVDQPRNYAGEDAPRFVPVPIIKPGGPVVALALGSGGSRAYASIGVLKALEAQGVIPDLIVGTAGGAILGALYAAGLSPDEIEAIALSHSLADLVDLTISDYGFIAGHALQARVARLLEDRTIEDLKKPFAAVVTHVETGGLEILNRGNAALAVRASTAAPGVFMPVIVDGAHYVDGGLVAPVPIRVAKQLGGDFVIAVDVQPRLDEAPAPRFYPSDWLARDVLTRRLIDAELDEGTLLLQPSVPYYGGFSENQKRQLIAAGERAVAEALPRLQRLINPVDPKAKQARLRRQRSGQVFHGA